MRMTQHTSYALRMLIYVALRPDGSCTVHDVAAAYGISRHHLLKVAQTLRGIGAIETTRGRAGGIRLAAPPGRINVGAVVRETEGACSLVECMAGDGACRITPACRLSGMLAAALAAYFAVLDRYTLADLVGNRRALRGLLDIDSQAA
ncbi:MAG: Rrf2 family transcriptional regulator [Acetobacteraceae bacterium]|nr:Rrf2 family transcriptional regulator [Acetobacteraceae bacterium]